MTQLYKLSHFIEILKTIKASTLIFIDADQCGYSLQCLDWVYKNYDVEPDYHIFVVTGNGVKIDKHVTKYSFITHIESQNNYRDAADFVLCSILNQAYTYSLITGNLYNYILASNDHFVFNACCEFRAVGQSIEMFDPKSNRLDLFAISMSQTNCLSYKGNIIKELMFQMEYKDIDIQDNIDFIFRDSVLQKPLKTHHIMIELERKGKGIDISHLMNKDDFKPEKNDLYLYVQSTYLFKQVKNDLLARKKINVCQLGNFYNINAEIKSRFGIKTWYQLLKKHPCVLEYLNANLETINGLSFIQLTNMNTSFQDSNKAFDNDNYLRTRWQIEWKYSAKDFCGMYNIPENDFTAWIQCNRPINPAGSYAVKKWLNVKK